LSRNGTTDTPFKFNGRYGVQTDPNGLLYMRARYYNPAIRRFVNQDVLFGQINSGMSLNRFAFANGNLVSLMDPFGLCASDRFVADSSEAGFTSEPVGPGNVHRTRESAVFPALVLEVTWTNCGFLPSRRLGGNSKIEIGDPTMTPTFFIRTEKELQEIETEADAIFLLGERLPGRVFRQTMGFFRFLNFVKFAQPEFGTMLMELAKLFGDKEVMMMTQDPSPFDYRRWIGVFGALRFPYLTSSQEYSAALHYDTDTGRKVPALYFSAYTIWWFGSSGKWGIYGNRDLDLAIGAVLLSDEKKDQWMKLSGPLWLSKQQAREAVLSNTGHKKDYTSVAQGFFKTYGMDAGSPNEERL
jgi:RHS repeat-associated protein